MKPTASVFYRLACGVLASQLIACASTTLIRSTPDGAKVYLNGEPVGTTPYTMTDTKIIGSTTGVRLEYPGYRTVETSITRSEQIEPAPAVVGFFLCWGIWLWAMGYKPDHHYELSSVDAATAPPPASRPSGL